MSSLNNIWCKLNTNLLSKYLNKLKVFLNQFEQSNTRKNESANRIAIYTSIFESFIKFAQTDREQTHQIYSQVVQFFHFIVSEFTFDASDVRERKLIDLIAEVVIKLEDELLTQKLISLESQDLNEVKFLMVFCIKCRLVVQQDQLVTILNSSVKIMLENIE